MKFPYVSRTLHEAKTAKLQEWGMAFENALIEAHKTISNLQTENRNLRQNLIAAENENANLKGELIAQAHEKGEPSPTQEKFETIKTSKSRKQK